MNFKAMLTKKTLFIGIILLLIFILAFWLRLFPARFGELQALDPFYLYRMSEYVVQHNFQLPSHDSLRYSPVGWDPSREYLGPFYIPAFLYLIVGFGMPYFQFALLYPAIMGAFAVLIFYFLAKELFNSKLAGLFSAFFLATVPAFITRTSAGFFEKEPTTAPFIMLTIYFFIKSFKTRSLKTGTLYGILSGLSLAIIGISWGGGQFIYLLYGGFIFLIFVVNIILVGLNSLKPFPSSLENLEKYLNINMLKAYAPTIFLGSFLPFLFKRHLSLTSFSLLIPLSALLILLVRFGAEFLIKKERISIKLSNIIPTLIILLFLGLLFGSMFSDDVSNLLERGISTITGQKHLFTTTVAESQPGNWNAIISTLSTANSNILLPQLAGISGYFSIFVLMILGIFLLLYIFLKKQDYLLLLPLLLIITSIYSVFSQIRLLFLVGPAAALLGGFFIAKIISITPRVNKKINVYVTSHKIGIFSIIIGIIVILTIIINFSSAFTYSNQLGPSICFPQGDQKCIEIQEDGSLKLAENQPWYQAMNFLSTNTSKDSVVLSWWDFGYWFQTRGQRTTVGDGGNTDFTLNQEVARWFTSDTSEWNNWTDKLKYRKVTHILMDYTLPGKYAAISTIATEGKNGRSLIKFNSQPSQTFQRENRTIIEYLYPYAPLALWIPTDGSGLTGSPMLIQTASGQVVSSNFVNNICTQNGIIRLENKQPSIDGCISLSSLGIYYLPEQDYNNIFSRLMFMDGNGLPVRKVFDNQLIKIYRIIYDG